MAGLDGHYSAHNIEERILAAIRASGVNPEQRLTPEALGALDHFHTGGRRATIELLEMAKIRKRDRVLDLGAGLTGPARMLVCMAGCRVVCLDASHEYCTGAALLNQFPCELSSRSEPCARRGAGPHSGAPGLVGRSAPVSLRNRLTRSRPNQDAA